MKTQPPRKQHGRKPSAALQAVSAGARSPRLPFAGWWLGGALILLAVAAYLPALRAGYIWDDNALTGNTWVRTFGGLGRIWSSPSLMPSEHHYWPLVYSSFWLEHLLWGLNPFGYHLTNVLLHGVCGVLVWRVLRRLGVPGAWLGAALFAVHPVHVESVAWIIERKDVLSGALYLGAALSYLRFEDNRTDGTDRTYGTYFLALGLFTLALLSKSIVVTLPVALGLAIWWKRGRLGWRDIAPLIPLALLAIVMTAADLRLYHSAQQLPKSGLDLPSRVQLAGGAFWRYLFKLLWPHPLATFYPTWSVGASKMMAWLPFAGVIGCLGGLWVFRGRIGRGPLAATFFFGLTLGPVLGLVDYEFLRLSWVADRFQYLASIGPIALAGAAITIKCGMRNVEYGMAEGQRTKDKGQIANSLFRILAGVLVVALGGLCFWQAGFYRDNLTLFGHAAAAYPECWPARHMHGYALMDAGRLPEAEAELAAALRLAPPDEMLAMNMALALMKQQKNDEAETYFKKALEINPKFTVGLSSYGVFVEGRGRREEAIALYETALRIDPGATDVMNNLGVALVNAGRMDEAVRTLERAVRINPLEARYHVTLGWALMKQGKFPEAVAECETALRLKADLATARNILAQAQAGLKQE